MKHRDFTQGGVAAGLLSFSWPVFVANFLQSANQVVDMLAVGLFVGESGLAALSNATTVGFVVNSFSLGLGAAATVLVAQRVGACDFYGALRAQRCALLAACACSAVAAIFAVVLAEPLYALMGIPADALADAVAYTRIWAAGLPGMFIVCAAGGVMKARGNARAPMALSLLGTIVNCAGAFALVGLGFGCAGAAWAFAAANTVTAIAAIAMLLRAHGRRTPPRVRRIDFAELCRLAAPAVFQQVVVNLSYLAITVMTNACGMAVVAGAGAATKVNTLAGMPIWAVGQAVSAASAQCAGAGDGVRAIAFARVGLVLALSSTCAVIALVQVFAPQLIGLFVEDAEAVEAGVLYLRMCCFANSLAYAAMYVFDSFAIATGAPRLAALNALLDAVVVRIGLALPFSAAFGFFGICLAQALSPLLPCAVGAAYCARFAKRRDETTRA